MDKEYIKSTKKKLLEIKSSLKDEKRMRSANGIAAASTTAILPFAIIDSFSYGSLSGCFVIPFVVILASTNSIFFYTSQKRINQAIVRFKNLKDEYNSQKQLVKKANH
jgi:hypothetical protein